jgi:hypothetical protein
MAIVEIFVFVVIMIIIGTIVEKCRDYEESSASYHPEKTLFSKIENGTIFTFDSFLDLTDVKEFYRKNNYISYTIRKNKCLWTNSD